MQIPFTNFVFKGLLLTKSVFVISSVKNAQNKTFFHCVTRFQTYFKADENSSIFVFCKKPIEKFLHLDFDLVSVKTGVLRHTFYLQYTVPFFLLNKKLVFLNGGYHSQKTMFEVRALVVVVASKQKHHYIDQTLRNFKLFHSFVSFINSADFSPIFDFNLNNKMFTEGSIFQKRFFKDVCFNFFCFNINY